MGIPKKVSKSVLKAKMLEYFREIERTGEELIVLDNNKPVLKIVPLKKVRNTAASLFKEQRGKVKYFEDINSTTEEEWEDK